MNFQFGPVNTYHLTASLKLRLGEYKDCPVDLVSGNSSFNYE